MCTYSSTEPNLYCTAASPCWRCLRLHPSHNLRPPPVASCNALSNFDHWVTKESIRLFSSLEFDSNLVTSGYRDRKIVDDMADFQSVEFKTFDGVTLRGDLYLPAEPNAPVVVLTHGVSLQSSLSLITIFMIAILALV